MRQMEHERDGWNLREGRGEKESVRNAREEVGVTAEEKIKEVAD